MPPVARQGIDNCDGAFPGVPAPGASGSPNVNVNGRQVMRQGDPFTPHAYVIDPFTIHGRVVVSGSSTVNINGKQAARIGDPLSCGAHIAQGSPNVNVGG